MSKTTLAQAETRLTHPMAPMVERFAVPLAYVALGIAIGLYVSRSKKAA